MNWLELKLKKLNYVKKTYFLNSILTRKLKILKENSIFKKKLKNPIF